MRILLWVVGLACATYFGYCVGWNRHDLLTNRELELATNRVESAENALKRAHTSLDGLRDEFEAARGAAIWAQNVGATIEIIDGEGVVRRVPPNEVRPDPPFTLRGLDLVQRKPIKVRGSISDEGLSLHRSAFASLTWVALKTSGDVNSEPFSLGFLESCNRVDSLRIEGPCTKEHLAQLKKCASIRRLEVFQFPESGFEVLRGMANLRVLTLSSSGTFTEHGLKHLFEMPDLEQVTLYSVNLTPTMLAALKQNRPKFRLVIR